MSTLAPSYGSRTEFGSDANLNGLTNGQAKPLGKVDNSTTPADAFKVDLTIALNSVGVSSSGTVTVYLIEAALDTTTTYTDQINPAGSTDVTSLLKNARPIRTYAANAVSQVVQDTFTLPVLEPPKYWSLVVANGSGAALAASGNSAYFTPINYSIA